MTVTSMRWNDALRYVRSLRPGVNPNLGFQRQLMRFEHTGQLDQERARFRRLYPPLTGTYDPHYHWRGHRKEDHYVDDILSRLIEIRVGPVEQAVRCGCAVSSPTGRTSYSANNAVDTTLPYNPWYGSYTEHRLQAMSIHDAGQVQVISPVAAALANPIVHPGLLEGYHQLLRSETEDPPSTKLSVISVESDSDGAVQQSVGNHRRVSVSDVIESMLNLKPLVNHEQTTKDLALQNKKKDRNESSRAKSVRKAAIADVQKKVSKAAPGVSKDDSEVVPDVSVDGNSSQSSIEDSEVSLFMAGSGHNLEDANLQSQLVDTQTTSNVSQRKKSEKEKHQDTLNNVSKNQKNLEQSDLVVGGSTDHASNMPTSADKSASNKTTLTAEQRRKKPHRRKNNDKNETESKEGSVTDYPVPRPRLSAKGNSSETSEVADSEETGQERTTQGGEPPQEFDSNEFGVEDELKPRRTESVNGLGGHEEMDVGQEDEEEDTEDVEMKSEKRSEEVLTSSTDQAEENSHHSPRLHHEQQEGLDTQLENGVEQTTSQDQRGVSTTDPSILTRDSDKESAVQAMAAADQTSAQNSGIFSGGAVEEIPDKESTTADKSTDNGSPMRGVTNGVGEQSKEVSQGESLTPDSNVKDSNPLSQDNAKFPKSGSGHTSSGQKDRRSKRLTKIVRIYHDLSTIIDYREDDKKAITTIHFK